MKNLLSIVLIFSIAVLSVSCSKPLPKGNYLRYNNGTDPQALDPAIIRGMPEYHIVMQIFEGLTAYNPKDLTPEPGVAEKWDISKDGLVYTFHIRTNAKWSDGTQVDAETFRYSWLRALNPDTAAAYAYQLWYVKNAEAYTKGKGKPEDVGIKVLDKYTLQVTLEQPVPYFLFLTGFQVYMPVPRHVIEKAGNNKWFLPQNFVGNGPFVLKEWKPKDHILITKNQQYWDKDKVKLDGALFFPYEDTATALEMFLNGELDWIDSIPPERLEQMKSAPEFVKADNAGIYYYNLNTKSDTPLKDMRVRKALYLTMNREYIAKYIGKLDQPVAYGFVPSSMPNYKGYSGEKENIGKAKKLLAEAGYPDGKGFPQLTILYNTMEGHKQIAETIQNFWKENLGIDVLLENQEWKVYDQKVKAMDYQIARAGWNGDYLDPMTFLDMFVTDGGNNNTGWSNPEYDRLIKSAKAENDTAKRSRMLYSAEKILIENVPVLPIYTYVRAFMVKTNVSGVYGNLLDFHPIKEVYFLNKKQ